MVHLLVPILRENQKVEQTRLVIIPSRWQLLAAMSEEPALHFSKDMGVAVSQSKYSTEKLFDGDTMVRTIRLFTKATTDIREYI